jgi:hypothetical protein
VVGLWNCLECGLALQLYGLGFVALMESLHPKWVRKNAAQSITLFYFGPIDFYKNDWCHSCFQVTT